jgi:formylglycine-generating enzyme required for sulfatase activity
MKPGPIEPLQEFEFETLTVNERGEEVERKSCRAQQFSEDLGNGVALEMVAISGGIFQMGSPAFAGYADERPQHLVSLAPFFMGRYPVTQAQWQAVMGKTLPCRFPGPNRPLDRVSWQDASQFCQRLARRSERAYRLPAEAEWEYACRARTGTPFYFGPTLTTDLANYVGEYIFAGEPRGIYRHVTTEVGSFPPNSFGLYDLHGGLWEWCADAWHDDYTGAPVDGSAWDGRNAPFRVVRGGSWHEPPNHCRSAVRLKFAPSERDDFVGFRVALSELK